MWKKGNNKCNRLSVILACTLFNLHTIFFRNTSEWISYFFSSCFVHCLSSQLHTNKFMIYYHPKFYWSISEEERKQRSNRSERQHQRCSTHSTQQCELEHIVVNKNKIKTEQNPMRWMMTINCRSFVIAMHQQKKRFSRAYGMVYLENCGNSSGKIKQFFDSFCSDQKKIIRKTAMCGYRQPTLASYQSRNARLTLSRLLIWRM